MEDNKQEEVVCKLKIIFEKLLDIKIESLDDLVFGKTKNWDSLKHLQIIINAVKVLMASQNRVFRFCNNNKNRRRTWHIW